MEMALKALFIPMQHMSIDECRDILPRVSGRTWYIVFNEEAQILKGSISSHSEFDEARCLLNKCILTAI